MCLTKNLFEDVASADARAAVNTRCVAKLYINFPDKSRRQGTGFLYGNNVLATAGHCIYDPRYGGKAESIDVVFPNGTTENVYRAKLYAPAKWLVATIENMNTLWKHDYGVIQLKGTPGRTLGFLDYQIISNSRLDQYMQDGKKVHVVGYPQYQTALKDNTGLIVSHSIDDIGYTASFVHGQSGGPVIVDGTDTFIAIANYVGSAPTPNTGGRITSTLADFLDLYY